MTYVATWYRREDYDLIVAIMDDGDEFPGTFEEWEQTALLAIAHSPFLAQAGASGDELVAAGFRHQDGRIRRIPLHLLAQAIDVGLQRVRSDPGIIPPYFLQ